MVFNLDTMHIRKVQLVWLPANSVDRT